jgi:hypothetical protein
VEEKLNISTEDYLKLSFLFDGNSQDKIVNDNLSLYLSLANDVQSIPYFDKLEPHKYDYKCFPIGSVLRQNRVLIQPPA